MLRPTRTNVILGAILLLFCIAGIYGCQIEDLHQRQKSLEQKVDSITDQVLIEIDTFYNAPGDTLITRKYGRVVKKAIDTPQRVGRITHPVTRQR